MYDTGKVIVGILIFLGLFLYPFWRPVVMGKAGPPPKLEKAAKGKECVESTEFMRKSHMKLLESWREAVVRDGMRIYVNQAGKKYLMSLQNTCVDCHKSTEKFCDRCHNYVNTSPKCWECHIRPEYKKEAKVAERSK